MKKGKKFTRRVWTDEEVEKLKEIYSTSTKSEVMEIFDRPLYSIYGKANSLGLKKTREVILRQSKDAWENRDDHPALKYHFKKGSKPFNKGMKQTDYMSKDGIESSAKTRFKEGDIPHNAREVGTSVMNEDGYMYLKVAEPNVIVLEHRHVWEQHHGPIPDGYNIQFKDKIRTNVDIDNLYMISKEDQMRENSGPLNLSDTTVAMFLDGGRNSTPEGREAMLAIPELIELKRNQILLNRQIKQNEKS